MSTEWQATQLAVYIERWIAEARGGSRVALERLIDLYAPYLLSMARRELCAALRSRVDPGDMVQDTLLKAWQKFFQFQGKTKADFLAWLRQILRNHLANQRRAHIKSAMRSIQREIPLAEVAELPRPEYSGCELGSLDRQAQTLERRELLEIALRQLPEHYRQVLHLHTREEMTFAQVGERLHCSAEAARKLWKRAAEKLAQLLRDV